VTCDTSLASSGGVNAEKITDALGCALCASQATDEDGIFHRPTPCATLISAKNGAMNDNKNTNDTVQRACCICDIALDIFSRQVSRMS